MSEINAGGYFGALRSAVLAAVTTNNKLQAALTFAIEGLDIERTVALSWEGGAREHTIKKLNGLGWNGDLSNPTWDDEAIQRVPLTMHFEQYTDKEGQQKQSEKWEMDRGGFVATPAADDITRRLQAELASVGVRPKRPATAAPPPPPGRSAAPPPRTPAAAAPPPRRPGPQAPPEKDPFSPASQEQAWASWCKQAELAGKSPANSDDFYKAVDTVAEKVGRKEAQFLPGDWAEVADMYAPF